VGKLTKKKAPVIKTFLDWVLHEGTKKQSRLRCAHELYLLEGSSGFIYDEFYELLEKSRFVSGVIDIHTRERAWREECIRIRYGSNELIPEHTDSEWRRFVDDSEWQAFVKDRLADWLFGITEILTMQAKLVASGDPMSRAELGSLFDAQFLGSQSEDVCLKDGRNEVWTASTLRKAVNRVLPEIKTVGAVTLSNLAKRINAHSREILFGRLKTRLTGKHLQKLLKKHGIDWIGLKKAYKQHLVAEGRARNQASSNSKRAA
jgi:hypothetical protein